MVRVGTEILDAKSGMVGELGRAIDASEPLQEYVATVLLGSVQP
jgi:hypothetical protein